jgi:hypothetical protein
MSEWINFSLNLATFEYLCDWQCDIDWIRKGVKSAHDSFEHRGRISNYKLFILEVIKAQ